MSYYDRAAGARRSWRHARVAAPVQNPINGGVPTIEDVKKTFVRCHGCGSAVPYLRTACVTGRHPWCPDCFERVKASPTCPACQERTGIVHHITNDYLANVQTNVFCHRCHNVGFFGEHPCRLICERVPLGGSGSMSIYAKSWDGAHTYTLRVEYNESGGFVKELLSRLSGIPSAQLRLIYAGRQLEQDHQLCDLNIQRETTICYSLKLRGDIGMFSTDYVVADGDDIIAHAAETLLLGGTVDSTLNDGPTAEEDAEIRRRIAEHIAARDTGHPPRPVDHESMPLGPTPLLDPTVCNMWRRQLDQAALDDGTRLLISTVATNVTEQEVLDGATALDRRFVCRQRVFCEASGLSPHVLEAVLSYARQQRVPDAIVFRRTVSDRRRQIRFHQDNAAYTAIVPLAAASCEGGRLLLLGDDGEFVAPDMLAGFAYGHHGDLVHAVTPITAGVRYTLYFIWARS